MPGQDGITTVRNIFKNSSIRDKPKILMVTAYGIDELRDESNDLSIDSFLLKPITYSSLFDEIMKIFGETKGIEPFSDDILEKLNNKLEFIRGASILLVEDNQINQQVAKEILESLGVNSKIANNGEEAVNIFIKDDYNEDYDLILMDIQMPVMDGYTATENLRLLKNALDIPIIAMTADAVTGVKERCITVGMNDYITKPISAEELAGVLKKMVTRKGL